MAGRGTSSTSRQESGIRDQRKLPGKPKPPMSRDGHGQAQESPIPNRKINKKQRAAGFRMNMPTLLDIPFENSLASCKSRLAAMVEKQVNIRTWRCLEIDEAGRKEGSVGRQCENKLSELIEGQASRSTPCTVYHDRLTCRFLHHDKVTETRKLAESR